VYTVKHCADNFNKIQASTMVSMRYLLFWDVTQHWLLIGYQNFGTIYWPHLPRVKQSSSPCPASPLKKGWRVVLKHPQPITNQHCVTYRTATTSTSTEVHYRQVTHTPATATGQKSTTCDGSNYKNYCLLGCDNVRLVDKYQHFGHVFFLFTLDSLMILLP